MEAPEKERLRSGRKAFIEHASSLPKTALLCKCKKALFLAPSILFLCFKQAHFCCVASELSCKVSRFSPGSKGRQLLSSGSRASLLLGAPCTLPAPPHLPPLALDLCGYVASGLLTTATRLLQTTLPAGSVLRGSLGYPRRVQVLLGVSGCSHPVFLDCNAQPTQRPVTSMEMALALPELDHCPEHQDSQAPALFQLAAWAA